MQKRVASFLRNDFVSKNFDKFREIINNQKLSKQLEKILNTFGRKT